MSPIRDQQIGLLEMVMYLMGVVAVIAAVAWNWDPVLLLLLIIVALPFLTYWEVRNIEPEHDLSRGIRRTIVNEGSLSQKQASRGSGSRQTDRHDKHRVHPQNSPHDCAEGAERNFMSPLNAGRREGIIDIGPAGFHPSSAMEPGGDPS